MKSLALLAIPAALVFAAQAHADSDSDYLSTLTNTYQIAPPLDPSGLLKMGHAVCDDIHNGRSPQFEASEIYRMAPPSWNWSDHTAGNLVSAAQLKLCPDTL